MSELEISVIIPTYRRRELLLECIASCVGNSRKPFEILIGDDSDEDIRAVIAAKFSDVPFPIIYLQNKPPLGQADNVDNLIRRASGTHICLIHDDDYLTQTALDVLARPFLEYGEELLISFGRQQLVDSAGSLDREGTEELNAAYRRTPEHAGLQPSMLKSAILQQIPNNGFLINAAMAKAVGYRQAGLQFKDGCDFGFSYLAAKRFPDRKAYFDPSFTTAYRLSDMSIARGKRNNNAAFYAFHNVIRDYPDPADADLRQWIRKNARKALSYAIKNARFDAIINWLTASGFVRRAVFTALVRG